MYADRGCTAYHSVASLQSNSATEVFTAIQALLQHGKSGFRSMQAMSGIHAGGNILIINATTNAGKGVDANDV
jgi:hypothetical protein